MKHIVLWRREKDESHYVICDDIMKTEVLLAELSSDTSNKGIECYELGAKVEWTQTITVKISG